MLVPELHCSDLEATKRFYVDLFGFEIKYERPEETFVYFTLDGSDLMVEQLSGPGRRWVTAAMERPFGRGVSFQWDVVDLDGIYARVKAAVPSAIYLEMETKAYRVGRETVHQRQFVAQDPDGYLFRFCCDGVAIGGG